MEDKVFNPVNITCKVYANWKFVEFYLANTIIWLSLKTPKKSAFYKRIGKRADRNLIMVISRIKVHYCPLISFFYDVFPKMGALNLKLASDAAMSRTGTCCKPDLSAQC
jgi:hypothetical protein